ncbi:MAG TPA: NUDIX domain-containing protein [Ktedonobacterales bacterium]|nr:NUDIX domain-containing protein [Ktedonobacterales bacterium]
MPRVRKKVLAYITHRRRLLVFRQPDFPEAGIQVPGGSVEPGETLEAAALREAREETGLGGLRLVRLLGVRDFDGRSRGRDEIYRRAFFHLRCQGAEPPEAWRHAEHTPSDGSPGPIAFELFWAPLPDGVPDLIAEMGALLPELIASL